MGGISCGSDLQLRGIPPTMGVHKGDPMRVFTLFLVALQVLTAPDPAQMEDAPDLGYRPVPHGLEIPDDVEMGAPSSVGWTSTNKILVFNR